MNNSRQTTAVLGLLAFFITVIALVLLVPPQAQPLSYHDFADGRTLFGVPNFFNVASNLPILLGGLAGLVFMSRRSLRTNAFIEPIEGRPYLLFFVSVVLTAFGSAYYHLAPSNSTLIWDRLPMSLMFMSLFAAILAERISRSVITYLTLPLLALGVCSVVGWALTEHLGHGDLRFYAVVQFFPMVCIPVVLRFFPSRYSNQSALLGSLGWYILAKLFETFDPQIYAGLGISGHTIKHMLCGLSAYWIVRMLQHRTALPAAEAR